VVLTVLSSVRAYPVGFVSKIFPQKSLLSPLTQAPAFRGMETVGNEFTGCLGYSWCTMEIHSFIFIFGFFRGGRPVGFMKHGFLIQDTVFCDRPRTFRAYPSRTGQSVHPINKSFSSYCVPTDDVLPSSPCAYPLFLYECFFSLNIMGRESGFCFRTAPSKMLFLRSLDGG